MEGIKNKQVLYLMKNNFGMFKIGISIDPNSRVRQLELASGTVINIVKCWECYKENAFTMEQRLHEHFKDYRTQGEWFTEVDEEYIESCILENSIIILTTSVEPVIKWCPVDKPINWMSTARTKFEDVLQRVNEQGFSQETVNEMFNVSYHKPEHERPPTLFNMGFRYYEDHMSTNSFQILEQLIVPDILKNEALNACSKGKTFFDDYKRNNPYGLLFDDLEPDKEVDIKYICKSIIKDLCISEDCVEFTKSSINVDGIFCDLTEVLRHLFWILDYHEDKKIKVSLCFLNSLQEYDKNFILKSKQFIIE